MNRATLLSLCCLLAIGAVSDVSAKLKPITTPPAAKENDMPMSGNRKAESTTPSKKNGGYIAVEGFYWKASEDGLEYATRIDSFSNQGQISTETQKYPEFSWDPGFRVEAGYLAGTHDEWVVSALWTRFNTDAKGKTSGDGVTSILIPAWAPVFFDVGQGPNSIFWVNGKTKQNLHYNTVDVTLGRDCFITTRFKTHPFLGVRYASINQHNRSTFLGTPQDTLTIKGKNDYFGVGLRAGNNLLWSFTDHWGILGGCSGALVYGEFDIKQSGAESRTPITFMLSNKFNAARINLEGALGLQWQNSVSFWSEKKYHVCVAAFYEVNEWFSVNELSAYVANTSANSVSYISRKGNLFLQGFNLRVDFEF